MPASPRTNRSVAIFDLDRTLIAGASWPVYAACLHKAGVPPKPLPALANAMFTLFKAFGESSVTMAATRAGIRRTTGWPLTAVDAAAEAAVPALLAQLQPYAPALFEQHRRAGRRLVMATTTPHRLVSPLATALGFDAVVATRYGITDGAFDGTVDGPFVWNRGKLDAVAAWAGEAGADLASSYAYSDSFYDGPLLAAVGHATAVNPDRRRLRPRARRHPGRARLRRRRPDGGRGAGPRGGRHRDDHAPGHDPRGGLRSSNRSWRAAGAQHVSPRRRGWR